MVVNTPSPLAATSPRSVTILGSTGSVGANTVDLITRNPDSFVVEALTGHRNVDLLAEQALVLRPKFVVVGEESGYRALKDALAGTGIEIAAGPSALVEAAKRPSDWVMASIVGAAGLEPTMEAIRRGAIVGLANKECLVCAGALMMDAVHQFGATLLPVDSEHSAIFQVFEFENAKQVAKIILTASGGPFRTRSRASMEDVTPAQAVAHPNWSMGAKISVDSATMMNKGLELIEAYHLFPVDVGKIDIVVHPQSVIHSLVEYVDGSVLAQLGSPDMRTPIAYALGWPSRMPAPSPRLDLAEISTLTFEQPDPERFPALRLAREALNRGGVAPAILNAANEVAVARFLEGGIGFLDIPRVVETVLCSISHRDANTLSDVSEADSEARDEAERAISLLGVAAAQ
jgi:1-deoxy-D-xylulose-5-phosphate reductoisomerase